MNTFSPRSTSVIKKRLVLHKPLKELFALRKRAQDFEILGDVPQAL